MSLAMTLIQARFARIALVWPEYFIIYVFFVDSLDS